MMMTFLDHFVIANDQLLGICVLLISWD